jgi:RNA polymerase sigma-70 factor (ECF subfamily)
MTTFACVQKLVSGVSGSAAAHQREIPVSEQAEAEIVRLAQTGDAAAFEHLYRTHSRRIYALCLRMTANPSLAEDLTQEAFLQVFRKIQTFRAESAFSTWLYRLAVNIVLMKRRLKTLNETPLEGTHETEGDAPQKEFGRSDPRVSGLVDRITLKGALTQLTRGYRQIFLLHDVLGYEHLEIAEALGCSIGNSKSQLHKARMRLRRILRGSSAKPISETIGHYANASKKNDSLFRAKRQDQEERSRAPHF